MKKLKVLVIFETILALATVYSYFVTKDSTDFSGFIVAYLIIAMMIVGIPILVIASNHFLKRGNKNNTQFIIGILLLLIVSLFLFGFI